MKNLYFKIKFGYGKKDYVVLDENEVQRAIYAMYSDKPIQLGEIFIRGSNIISITPHYHAYTGWNESYEAKEAEDFLQIEKDCPNFTGRLETIKNHVIKLVQEKKLSEIGKPIPNLIENQKGFLHTI
jgi:hypothetical protein